MYANIDARTIVTHPVVITAAGKTDDDAAVGSSMILVSNCGCSNVCVAAAATTTGTAAVDVAAFDNNNTLGPLSTYSQATHQRKYRLRMRCCICQGEAYGIWNTSKTMPYRY